MTDKSIIYVIQEFRCDIYKRMIIRETYADIEDWVTDWLASEHQASEHIAVYKIVFTAYTSPKFTLLKRYPEERFTG